jgi:hypothetical protein
VGDKIYLIYASTGCTCCSEENHYRGPYKSKEDCEKRIKYYKTSNYWPVASQYSQRGNYSIKEYSLEEISKDRYIVGGVHVYSKGEISFIEVNEDGTLKYIKDEEERFYLG